MNSVVAGQIGRALTFAKKIGRRSLRCHRNLPGGCAALCVRTISLTPGRNNATPTTSRRAGYSTFGRRHDRPAKRVAKAQLWGRANSIVTGSTRKATGPGIHVPRPARTERAESGAAPAARWRNRTGSHRSWTDGHIQRRLNGPPRPAKARRQTGRPKRQAAGRAAPTDWSGLAPDHDESGAPVPRGTIGSDANPSGEGVCFDVAATG